jgi:uncharacterized protein (DUF362 family)
MDFGLHPLLKDPDAVLVYREPVAESPCPEDFERIARRTLEIMQVSLAGQKVAIKPNLTSGEHFADPDSGITTHPAFVGGLVRYLYQHGAKPGGIYIVEDPRDSDDNNPRHWRGTGFHEMASATGAQIRCPNTFYCVKKVVPQPFVHPVRKVTRYAVDPNTLLIDVPKMKTHNLGITSLCLKNLMGLDDVYERHYCGQAWKELPANRVFNDRPKNEWMDLELHETWQAGLGRRLADLAKVVPPALNIVEGVIARDGTGFNRGTNFPLGLSVSGTNLVAVDSVTSYIMGFNPRELVYLKVAHEAGLGNNDLSNLRLYVAENGKIVPCEDARRLKSPVPFAVIRDIIGNA